jgi:uncharacterized protein (TIRG00374 family)
MAKLNSRARYWIAALAIAGLFLYLSLRGVDWGQVGHTLSRANPLYIAATFVISSVTLLLRAIRWRILLRYTAPVTVATAFWATSAGYFGNSFLPARAGEMVRTVIISVRTGLSKTFVLTTALGERVSDAVTLVFISSIVLLTLSVRPGWFDRAAKPFAIVGLCGTACIAVLPRMESLWRVLLIQLPIPQELCEKIIRALEQILIGLRSFHDRVRLTQFAGLAAVIWMGDGAGTVVLMRALGLSISLPIAFLLITGFGLGSALPATPGYVGVYQFVAVSVLTPFGFAKGDAIAYSFLVQAIQLVFTAFWGLLGLSRQRGLNLTSSMERDAA